MTKHKNHENHPIAITFYQLGKDVGDINRRLAVIEQREQSAQPSQPQAEAVTMPQQDAVAINNINAVLEAVEKYKTFEKYNTQWQERFEKFLSRNPNDYELSEEQRQKLYHTMCQHLWQVNFTEINSKQYELPIRNNSRVSLAILSKPRAVAQKLVLSCYLKLTALIFIRIAIFPRAVAM